MTVTNESILAGPYTGNGVTAEFSYAFTVEDDSEIRVFETDTDGVITELDLTTDFTVNTGTKTVTRVDGALPAGYKWLIRSNIGASQETSFASQGSFLPAVHEAAVDKLTRLMQQIEDKVSRSLRLADSDPLTGNMILASVADRANKIFGFDAEGEQAYLDPSFDPGEYVISTSPVAGALTQYDSEGQLSGSNLLRFVLGSGTPAQNTAKLLTALSAKDTVVVGAGTYDPVELSAAGKTLYMRPGVVFKLPNGTVASEDVTGPSVVDISGDNITIHGDFTVDGNRANNDSSGFPTSVKVGSLDISGDNCKLNGTVTLLNPYYMGISVNGGDDTGNEVDGFYARKIKVIDPAYYSTLFWTMENWNVEEIVIENSLSTDGRIRTGTQNTATGECKDGRIGRILSNQAVVVEAGTKDVHFDDVTARSWKCEAADNITFDKIRTRGNTTTDFGFAVIDSTGVQGGSVHVEGYNGTQDNVISLSGAFNGHIDSVMVSGTVANARDMRIRSAENFTMDSVILVDPVGTGDGLLYDYDAGYAPQNNIRIGCLVSKGHTTSDVGLEAGGDISIGWINDDAVKTGARALAHINYDPPTKGTFTAALTADTGTVTLDTAYDTLAWYKTGDMVHVTGTLICSAIDTPTGVLRIENLPFTNIDLGDRAEDAAFTILEENFTAGTGSSLVGIIGGGWDYIEIRRRSPGTFDAQIADELTETSRISISGWFRSAT